ncbi:dna cytosine-5--methyltransferase [Trichoderma cornu-damae]|uniref:DNA (cytosine-5-)-methyltransferase n=1 Tax=Trichoderma cornu-damae TaxID=654480 RepID=A0A9P8QQ64_9HYPO|nr:dna cytosine-5--methyltransferase [Trichoderma cornu-damae]
MASHMIVDSVEEEEEEEDDDEVQVLTSRRAFEGRSRSTSSDTLGRGSPDEGELEELAQLFEEEVIDLTGHASESGTRDLLREGEVARETYRKASSGAVFSRGDLVQVRDVHLGTYEIDFVRIQVIARHRCGDYTIRGVPFVRTRRLQGRLPKKTNEVCMMLHIQRREGGRELPAVLVDVPPTSIVKKRSLVVTNAVYPEHCCDMDELGAHAGSEATRQRLAELYGKLVCRWKFVIYFTVQGRSRTTTRPEEEVLERVQSDEAPSQEHRVSDEVLCNQWRGGRVRGGSWPPRGSGIIDLEAQTPSRDAARRQGSRRMGQKYTLFDSFSGAGGVSRGAQGSGFKVQYAATYRANFRDAELFRMSVSDFIQASKDRQMRVDVLHLSPPCQYFSPAHTHESARDDDNIFAMFGCNPLIRKLRPRLITLEQTFGITFERHGKYLRALLGDYTQFGYSVRWKVVRLCTWGSAQDRKRLIMLAAGPGEKLPPFPRPTHSENGVGGLEPFTTIQRAIGSVRAGDDLHNLGDVKRFHPPRRSLDPDRLAGTVTTGGSGLYHPDGTRDLTIREYACLQGFPKRHRFFGTRTSMRKQIGNAFPPNTVRVLYQHLEDWLLQQDGMRRCQAAGGDVAMVDGTGDSPTGHRLSPGAPPPPEMEEEDVVEIASPHGQPRSVPQIDRPVIDLT